MANIYYSHPSNRRGVLRAVLSTEEGKSLLKGHSAQYAGRDFPTMVREPDGDFAILRLFEGEVTEQWRPGFYWFHEDILRIEEVVQSYNAKDMW